MNHREDFTKRIREEAGPHALVTSSMVQALHWITNPSIPISGIYLNPADASYSALRFLEILATQRPATPLFLVHDEHDLSQEHHHRIHALAPVIRHFHSGESVDALLEPLRRQSKAPQHPARTRELAPREKAGKHPGHIAIPVVDFIHCQTCPLDLFVENESQQLRLFAAANSVLDHEYVSRASQESPWFFVSEESIRQNLENIRSAQDNGSDLSFLPLSWRTAETLYRSRMLLEEMRRGGLSDQLVEQSHFLMTDIFHLVSHLATDSRLGQFVEQTKQCDRTVACATLSILMCKGLKFEKNAIVEILGLASLFQDVALYVSPFGNLAETRPHELTGQAHKYYLQHPVLSADLVAQATSVPEVTIQVMRQHHERKDRTGFPNRIGGMQLHPMAEVLSLINAYLDCEHHTQAAHDEIFSHYSERIVSVFKVLVQALERSKAA